MAATAAQNMMTDPPRRFPPPWYVDEVTDGFCVRDDRGQAAVDHLWTWSRPSPWRSGGISCLRSRLAAFRVWYHNGEESWDELRRRLDAEWCPQNVAG